MSPSVSVKVLLRVLKTTELTDPDGEVDGGEHGAEVGGGEGEARPGEQVPHVVHRAPQQRKTVKRKQGHKSATPL